MLEQNYGLSFGIPSYREILNKSKHAVSKYNGTIKYNAHTQRHTNLVPKEILYNNFTWQTTGNNGYKH